MNQLCHWVGATCVRSIAILSLLIGSSINVSLGQSDPVSGIAKISSTSGSFGGTLAASAAFGRACAGLGDVDADGVPDLAVAMRSNDGGTERGAVWILFLQANGTVKSHQKISSTQGGFSGVLDNDDNMALRIAAMGDLNNDGVPDLAVSALGDDDGGTDMGAIYILFLSRQGSVLSYQKISATTGGFSGSFDADDQFGSALAAIGDLDHDGTTELFVSAQLEDSGGADRGAGWVLFLRPNGTVKSTHKLAYSTGGLGSYPGANGAEFGIGASGIGDLDNDGVNDLLVSARKEDLWGAMQVLFMKPDGTVKSRTKIGKNTGGLQLGGSASNDFAFGMCPLDMRSGKQQVVATIRLHDEGGTDTGASIALRLNADGTVNSEAVISPTYGHGSLTLGLDAADQFGFSTAAIGDLDGNGSLDFAVGSKFDDDGYTDAGAVYIFFTPALPVVGDVTAAIENVTVDGATNGSIALTTTGTTGTLSYSWSGTSSTTNTAEDLAVGSYQVTVSAGSQAVETLVLGVGYDVDWRTLEYMDAVTGGIAHDDDTSAWAYATSSNKLPNGAQGWLEYTVEGPESFRAFGYTGLANTDTAYWAVENGFLLGDHGILNTIHNDTLIHIGRYKKNDVLRVRKTAAKWMYYVNGTAKDSSSIGTDKVRAIRGAIYQQPGWFIGMRSSVKPTVMATIQKQNNTTYEPQRGYMTAVPQWGNAPFTYRWSTGATTQSITGLNDGTRWVVVKDAAGDSVQVSATINTDVTFFSIEGAEYSNNTLTKTDTAGWNSIAVSENVIADGDSGWVSTRIGGEDMDLALALKDIGSELGYGMLIDQGVLYAYFDSDKEGATAILDGVGGTIHPLKNDVLRIERQAGSNGSKILFLLNDEVVLIHDELGTHPDLVFTAELRSTDARAHDFTGYFTLTNSNANDCVLEHYNYTKVTTYAEDGSVRSVSKSFIDKLGRTIQTQTKDIEATNVLIAQIAFDSYGRAALQSLPAPGYKSTVDCFRKKFIGDPNGANYTYDDFDLPNTTSNVAGEQYEPKVVNTAVKGTLGWYYSNNNTSEAYVPASAVPYSRMIFQNDPIGAVQEQYAPGDSLKAGSGHGTKQFVMVGADALERVSFKENWGPATTVTKTITVNADGLEVITYNNDLGQVLATCRSGMASQCTVQEFHVPMRTDGGRYLDVHIPVSQKGALKLVEVHNGVFGQAIGTDLEDRDHVVFSLFNIETGRPLVEGEDYTLTETQTGTWAVQFSNGYATGPSYLRIAYELFFVNAEADPENPGSPYDLSEMPDQEVWFKLDYGYWSLSQYDNLGNLVAVVPPEGVSCNETVNWLPTITREFSKAAAICETQTDANGFHLLPMTIDDRIDQSIYSLTAAMNTSFSIDPGYTAHLSLDVGLWGNDILQEPEEPSDYLDEYRPMNEADEQSNPCGYVVHDNTPPPYEVDGWAQLSFLNSNSGYDTPQPRPNRSNPFVSGAPTHRWFNYNPGVYDPYSPCDDPNYVHCSDDIWNCGEIAVDIGGSCGLPPCFEEPPQVMARYNVILGAVFVDDGVESGVVASRGYALTLWRTCDCEFLWDFNNFNDDHQMFTFAFTPTQLETIDDIRLRLLGVSVDVSDDGAGYAPYDPDEYVHDLARFLSFQVFGHLQFVPEPIDPPDHQMVQQFEYSEFKQLITSTDGDHGTTEMVYDTRGQLRFSQNAEQAITDANGHKRFGFVDYDRAGRSIRTGVYKYTPNDANHIQFEHMANDLVGQGLTTTMDSGILDAVVNFSVNNLEEVTTLLYDAVDPNFNASVYQNGTQHVLPGQVSRTQNAETTTWYSYDVRGRLIWTAHHVNELNKSYSIAYTYNVKGELERTSYQPNLLSERFDHWYQYDANGRPIRVLTGTDGVFNNATERAEYKYYLHGPLKRTELGGQLQGLDYVYTIQGWLKALNAPGQTSHDPGKDGLNGSANAPFGRDLFGMALDYFEGDYERNGTHVRSNVGYGCSQVQERFTGLVKTQRWYNRGLNDQNLRFPDTPLLYAYKYDALGQLTEANLAIFIPDPGATLPGQTWDPTVSFKSDYRVWGLTYDKNGNIRSLNRNGHYQAGFDMDQLTYNYTVDQNGKLTTHNRLGSVTDAVTTSPYSGTDLPSGQQASNYAYNAIGQLTADANEGKYYSYNGSGLVKAVYSDAQHTQMKARYTYDDKGKRLLKESYDVNNTVTGRVWYMNDGTGSLVDQLFTDDQNVVEREEQPVKGIGRIGFYDHLHASTRYELTDHLGNVRVGFTESNGVAFVIEAHDYYPHGMMMPGRSISSAEGGAYAYQGKEVDAATGMIDFDLRDYDARLGRWVVCDPMGQYASPYLGMANNPIQAVDPDGGYSEYIGGEWYTDINQEQARALRQGEFYENALDAFNAMNSHGNSQASYGVSDGQDASGRSYDTESMIFESAQNYAYRNHNIYENNGALGWLSCPQSNRKIRNYIDEKTGEFVTGLKEVTVCSFKSSFWLNNEPSGNTWREDFSHAVHTGHGLLNIAEGTFEAVEHFSESKMIRSAPKLIATWAPRVAKWTTPLAKRLPVVGLAASVVDLGVNWEDPNARADKKAEVAFHAFCTATALVPGGGWLVALGLETAFYFYGTEMLTELRKLD